MQDTFDIKPLRSESSVDRETTAALGGTSSPFSLPPITAGRLALLDLVDSPLLRGGAMTSRDVWMAAWIIAAGPAAVAPINRAVREWKALQEAKELASGNIDAMREYLAALRASAAHWDDVDCAITHFAQATGLLPEQMAAMIGDGITTAMAGFEMVEGEAKTGEDEKKNTGATPNGWRGWLRRLLRLCHP